jgi:putative transposase
LSRAETIPEGATFGELVINPTSGHASLEALKLAGAEALSGPCQRNLTLSQPGGAFSLSDMTQRSPFRYFKTSPEVIRLAVMLYVRFPLSLRNVEDLLHERGIEVSHETVRFWWQRFGPMFAAEIRRRRVGQMRSSRWRWQLDEVFVKINGVQHYLWRAVDHEGEVLEAFVSKTRDRKSALKFLRKLIKRHGRPEELVTDKLRSYGAALKELGIQDRQLTDRWENNRAENSHQPFRRRERAMLRFRRMRRLQKFAAVHASVRNLFNSGRSLTSRDTYKAARTAALAEWRALYVD